MLKLISINIEDEKHLDRLLPFLEREKPDVLCVQELLEKDFPLFEEIMGKPGHFSPMGILPARKTVSGKDSVIGIGLLSCDALSDISESYYVGKREDLRPWTSESELPINRVLLTGKIEKEGIAYTVATTHFTWTENGRPNDRQRKDLVSLLPLLDRHHEIILTGDMNAPRGMAIFDELASRYRDNIPIEYKSTLDPALHSLKGSLDRMVDVLFTTPEYEVKDIRLTFGLSDHAAIVAQIQKV